jgi:hypothetical protein
MIGHNSRERRARLFRSCGKLRMRVAIPGLEI